jgi:hypothetical protein
MLRVKIGSHPYQEVSWAAGEREVTGLAGLTSLNGVWSAGFRATEIQVLVGGRLQFLGVMSMQAFKVKVEYVEDSLINY